MTPLVIIKQLKFFLLFCFFIGLLQAEDAILFNYGSSIDVNLNKIQKTQTKLHLQYIYNQGVKELQNKNYNQAISNFEQTLQTIKVPSLLNLGISYYNLNQTDEAISNFEQILNIKNITKYDHFAYLSANYYLFLTTQNTAYANNALDSFYNRKLSTQLSKLLIIDLHILLKQYAKSILLLEKLDKKNDFKLGILYAKIKQYNKAQKYLTLAYNNALLQDRKNDILWVKIFIDLKSNNLMVLKEDLNSLSKRKKGFKSHIKMPLKIFFNQNIKTKDEYLKDLLKLKISTKIDLIYYFAPYLFFDDENIMYSLAPKLASNQSPEQYKYMLEYSKKILNILKMDPIKRSIAMQEDIDQKTDTFSYEYYNLALSYAQIKDYKRAYDNFLKAYRLNKGNNLYIAMVLATHKKVDIPLDKEEEIVMIKQLTSKQGDYDYFAKQIFNIINNDYYDLKDLPISAMHKNSLFYRALTFLDNYNLKSKKALSVFKIQDGKDAMVSLFMMLENTKHLNRANYIAKVQNALPTKYNEYYLKNAWIVSDFYIKMLRAFSLFEGANLEITDNNNPTYLKIKAYVYLFSNKAKVARVLLTLLQERYNLEDIDTNYYLACSMLDVGDEANAWSVFLDMEYKYKNKDAKFLNGLRLLSDLKIDSAINKFTSKYNGEMVDFSLENYETLLQTL